MLDKTYRPKEVEAKRYKQWEELGAFAARPDANEAPYTIIMPPPNVTGSLHIGHALTFTIQDILIRYNRMAGRDALWQPGMDHAGIATQMMVERALDKEGLHRRDLGRERFLERVWDWKAESGGTILKQLRHLGASADWARTCFTMDDGPSAAVRKVFVDLYKQGLIYRDKRLVNWDPKLHTAISDLEVEQRETQGKLWHFKYPIEGEEGRFIVVATTRPETMLGDSGVAVHPEDDRYRDLVGRHAILPLVGRRLPVVADAYADPEQGSGAVKMTPAHDFNDFEVGRRHDLEMINILDQDAVLNDNVPERYRGLDRYAARERVVADLEAEGLLEKVDEHLHNVPHGDRSGVAVEPWLTDQWFADAATLAKPAIAAVEDGRTVFVPKQWENTYFEWMRNIQPWCISRQLWWGHRIPAWYGPDGEIFVEESETAALAAAEAHYGKAAELRQDGDVLDTWFSSALWPFSTLGWPQETAELKRYYPGDVLVTGFDIIFFWVARMMMMGLHFRGEVPFRTVYIHGLIRDKFGRKMSKTTGNVVDPLETVEAYGCDALRFGLAALLAPGRDIKLDTDRIEGFRNFATKLWNASRYGLMNGAALDPGFDPAGCSGKINRWIVGRAVVTMQKLTAAIDSYRFDEAADLLYHFTWHEFCDWYIEFSKPVLTGDDEAAAAETRATMAWTLAQILHLLHPFMPFITEELWEQLGGAKAGALISRRLPDPDPRLVDTALNSELDWVIALIRDVRSLRSETNVPGSAKIDLLLRPEGEGVAARLAEYRGFVERLARLSDIKPLDGEAPAGSVPVLVEGATAVLPLADVIDVGKEVASLQKDIAGLDQDYTKLDRKLSNAQFLAKAPLEVVEENRQRREALVEKRAKLTAALERLTGEGPAREA